MGFHFRAACSETEVSDIASLYSAVLSKTAAEVAALFNEAPTAHAANVCEYTSQTVANLALIFDEAGLAAQKAADIFDHANLTEAQAKAIAIHTNLSQARYDAIVALMTDPDKVYILATLARFQANAATGTFSTSPNYINDNNTGNWAKANAEGQYAEVNFVRIVLINQWRIWGRNENNNDGSWKIEYYGTDLAWHDWKTGIVTGEGVWTDMSSEDEVACYKIRLTCTAVDSNSRDSNCGQLEVYHS